jgi:multidrug resistance efflux pump
MATTNDIHEDQAASSHEERHPHHRHSVGYWLIFAAIVLLIAALVYFFAWLPRHKRQQALEKETRQDVQAIPKVRVLRVERAPAGADLQIPGTTLAYEQASVYARASGYLGRRLVDIGDHVHEGQLLAIVDAPDLDKQVAQAASTLAQSRSALAQMEAQLHLQSLNNDRYKVLVARGVFSRQQGDQQEADSVLPRRMFRRPKAPCRPIVTTSSAFACYSSMSTSSRPLTESSQRAMSTSAISSTPPAQVRLALRRAA